MTKEQKIASSGTGHFTFLQYYGMERMVLTGAFEPFLTSISPFFRNNMILSLHNKSKRATTEKVFIPVQVRVRASDFMKSGHESSRDVTRKLQRVALLPSMAMALHPSSLRQLLLVAKCSTGGSVKVFSLFL